MPESESIVIQPKSKIACQESSFEGQVTYQPYIAHPYAMQENFIGRKQEREVLTDWLKRKYHPLLSIVAIGGMGKTSLAWYWLHEDILGSEEQPRKILWWSFYDLESGFDRFLKKAIEYFGDDKVDWNSITSTREQMEFLYTYLCNNRFLLILDGVERILRAYYGSDSPYRSDAIEENEKGNFRSCIEPNCGIFLRWLASSNIMTKTVVISRLYPKELDGLEGCLRMDLKQMDKEDAVEFLYRQGVKGTRKKIEEACSTFGFHPLSLRLLSGIIIHDKKYSGDISAWKK